MKLMNLLQQVYGTSEGKNNFLVEDIRKNAFLRQRPVFTNPTLGSGAIDCRAKVSISSNHNPSSFTNSTSRRARS
ncbi:hypothetical protein ONS95_011835 [Cadophora gregata]|uniref:uncharacterized protein n=1 Tax=Cadophora gregata TaxID=51156 RepID=UPI0026DD5F10|nr:uncharacterized protein ONS95_011835 [Cadophora gregata]KAK0117495.1 hypothetical protein ONS95_011835 [Cadophora gregata]KAK0122550.1 hypothetical protein ONS96_009592 [Cadophora gregata f. sp. sojae]